MSEILLGNMTAETITTPIVTLTRFIQALGGILILYLIFSIINTIIVWKKNKGIKRINQNLEEIKKLISRRIKN